MSEAETKPAKTKPKKSANKKSGGALAVFSLLIALIACAGVAVVWWQNQLSNQQAAAATQNFENQIQTELNKAAQVIQEQQQSQAATTTTLQQFIAKQGGDDSAWVFDRANSLLQLAKYNLEFQHDTTIAVQMLQLINQQMAALNTPSVLAFRKVLANDIAALKAIKPVDKPGLILQLNALSNQVEKLPVIPTQEATTTTTAQATTSDEPVWKRAWQQSLASLKSAVIVRHHDNPIAPLISPTQKSYLVENIQMQLALASWAVLHNQQTVFEASLKQAKLWLTQYFVQNDQGTKSLLDSIDGLMKTNLAPQLPSLADAFSALKSLQNQD